jgi:hypothetical protein
MEVTRREGNGLSWRKKVRKVEGAAVFICSGRRRACRLNSGLGRARVRGWPVLLAAARGNPSTTR